MAATNVPSRAFKPQNAGKSKFPAFYWDAKGDRTLVNSAAEIPAGATPYSPKDPAAADKAKAAVAIAKPAAPPAKSNTAPPRQSAAPAAPPLPGQTAGQVLPPRANIIAELQKRNVKFNAQSPTKALYDLLHGYIEANES